jgi:uncharacterized membrane protein YfcA
MVLAVIGIGFVIGLSVGLTGIGGGSLLTPLLIWFGLPVSTAVGTDLVYNVGTKLAGALQHWRQDGIAWQWVGPLAAGGVPMALIGSLLSIHIGASPVAVHLLRHVVGAALILAGFTTALKTVAGRPRPPASPTPQAAPSTPDLARESGPGRFVVLGAVIGFLIGLTSIGAGSLIAPALLLWTRISPRRIVGTDIASALTLTVVAGGTHLVWGHVDIQMALWLLLGSVPGALLGSRFTVRTAEGPLRTALSGLVVLSGVALL